MKSKKQMPDSWQVVRLGDVAEINQSNWNPGQGSTILYLDLTSVIEPGILAPPKKLAAKEAPSRARRQVRPGDILVSTVRPNLRGFARVPEAPRNLVASTGFAVVSPRRIVNGSFVYQHVMTSQFAQYLENAATGQAYPAVLASDVAGFRLPVPPLPEQLAIAAVLDSIDEAIERTEAVIAATERLRDALLHELLTRGVPGWHSEWKEVPGIGTIPACWDVVRLGDVGKWLSGGTPHKGRPDYWCGRIPWISPKDMKTRELRSATDSISEEGAKAGSRIVPASSILLVVRGMILAHSFPMSITRISCAFNQDIKALVCNSEFNPEYVLAALNWRRPHLITLPSPSTHGTMRVATEDLHSVGLPKPPIQEQYAIARVVDNLLTCESDDRQVLECLTSMKASVSDALLTGRVRVSSWEG